MRGSTNDKEAIIAINWLILTSGFFTRGSPHKPQINSPVFDFL